MDLGSLRSDLLPDTQRPPPLQPLCSCRDHSATYPLPKALLLRHRRATLQRCPGHPSLGTSAHVNGLFLPGRQCWPSVRVAFKEEGSVSGSWARGPKAPPCLCAQHWESLGPWAPSRAAAAGCAEQCWLAVPLAGMQLPPGSAPPPPSAAAERRRQEVRRAAGRGPATVPCPQPYCKGPVSRGLKRALSRGPSRGSPPNSAPAARPRPQGPLWGRGSRETPEGSCRRR